MAATEHTPRQLETLLQHVAQPVNPFFTVPPPGVYTLLVDENDAEMLRQVAKGLVPRQLLPSTGKMAYIAWDSHLKVPSGRDAHVEQRWAQRGIGGAAVNAGALRGTAYAVGRHSWPGETGIGLSDPLPIDLNFGPIHVCCSDATKFDIKELRETLKFADKITEHYYIWHLIHNNGQMKTDRPCMPIALSLSVNPVVVNFWDASVHAHVQPGTQVYLTLRELPGVPVLSAINPAPNVQWKKVGLFAYDDWLHVYSPETDAECADHAAFTSAAES